LADWISVTGIEGKVDGIQTRATMVTSQEGRDVFISNSVLFTNPFAVNRKAARERQSGDSGEHPQG
jgi:small-conductance mechanosensitive channel